MAEGDAGTKDRVRRTEREKRGKGTSLAGVGRTHGAQGGAAFARAAPPLATAAGRAASPGGGFFLIGRDPPRLANEREPRDPARRRPPLRRRRGRSERTKGGCAGGD